MKEFNPNYLGDGDLIVYDDSDIHVKTNSMSVFSSKDAYRSPHKLQSKYPLPTMKYKHGGYKCVWFDVKEWYKVTVIQGWDEGDMEEQEYLVLEENINQEIDELEQHWFTQAINCYLIHQMTREGDYRLMTNDEIYARQKIDEESTPIVRTSNLILTLDEMFHEDSDEGYGDAE